MLSLCYLLRFGHKHCSLACVFLAIGRWYPLIKLFMRRNDDTRHKKPQTRQNRHNLLLACSRLRYGDIKSANESAVNLEVKYWTWTPCDYVRYTFYQLKLNMRTRGLHPHWSGHGGWSLEPTVPQTCRLLVYRYFWVLFLTSSTSYVVKVLQLMLSISDI